MSGSPEKVNPPRSDRKAGSVALRLVSAAEVSDLAAPALLPPDLRVDEAQARRIYRSRWHAVVRAHFPNGYRAPVHRGFAKTLREHLDGRRPATGFAPDFVEIIFGVLDNSDDSWRDAEAVGRYLTTVVDPRGERPADLAVRFVDTSNIDPHLPEDMRTQR